MWIARIGVDCVLIFLWIDELIAGTEAIGLGQHVPRIVHEEVTLSTLGLIPRVELGIWTDF